MVEPHVECRPAGRGELCRGPIHGRGARTLEDLDQVLSRSQDGRHDAGTARTETGPESARNGPAMTEWFRVGDVVSDGIRCRVGEVNAIDGDDLEFVRPSGLMWWGSKYHGRQASRRERESLETNRT